MYKGVFRTLKLPKGFTRHEIAKVWTALNRELNAVALCTVWHWRGRDVCNGKFLVMPVKRHKKKFRYRAFAHAKKL